MIWRAQAIKAQRGGAGDLSGCPASGCNGYELTANIDLLSLLDTSGDEMIDTTMVGIDKNANTHTNDPGEQVTVISTGDTSWMPISIFTGNFEGNNHTISNLWVHVSLGGHSYAGLFGVTGGRVIIRNVGVISGAVHSSSPNLARHAAHSGGLVGQNGGTLTITNSYFFWIWWCLFFFCWSLCLFWRSGR